MTRTAATTPTPAAPTPQAKPVLTIFSWMKLAEEDDFASGCLLETARISHFDLKVTGTTPDELKINIARAMCCEPDAVTLDACDEPGRIDVQVMENADGMQPSPHELKSWEAGQTKLWSVDYTGYAFTVVPAASLLGGAK